MHLTCYLRKGVVYIPTLGHVHQGPYLHIEPVSVVAASDTAGFKRALLETAARGNPRVAMPSREELSKPMLEKYAGVKSFSIFARGTFVWHVEFRAGQYRIIPQKNAKPRGWVDDLDRIVTFPAEATVDDFFGALISMIQAHPAVAELSSPVTLAQPAEATSTPDDDDIYALPADWLHLPDEERIDELGDFAEWIANAKPQDEAGIRADIQRLFYDNSDFRGGDAVSAFLEDILELDVSLEDRQAILDQLDHFTRTDPRHVAGFKWVLLPAIATAAAFLRLRGDWSRVAEQAKRREACIKARRKQLPH